MPSRVWHLGRLAQLVERSLDVRKVQRFEPSTAHMELKIIYEDKDVLVVDKPAGIVVFPENGAGKKTLIDCLIEKYPQLKLCGVRPRYGIVHRLDKDTSGVLLVAKNEKALKFLQEQFAKKKVIKKYLALVVGKIKENQGEIKTLIGKAEKDRKKQKAYLFSTPEAEKKGLRIAETSYKVVKQYKDFTLLEVQPKTGRKHQIRCHLAFMGHPIAGDKVYGFKNQPKPEGLGRQFLHANYLKIKLPSGNEKELHSELPRDLKEILGKLRL